MNDAQNTLTKFLSSEYYLIDDPAIDSNSGDPLVQIVHPWYELISKAFAHFFQFPFAESPPQLHLIRSWNRKSISINIDDHDYIVVDLQILLDMDHFTKIFLFAMTEEPSIAYSFLYLTQRYITLDAIENANSMFELFLQWKEKFGVSSYTERQTLLSMINIFFVLGHELAHFYIRKSKNSFGLHFENTRNLIRAIAEGAKEQVPNDKYRRSEKLLHEMSSSEHVLVEESICDRLALYISRQILCDAFGIPFKEVAEGICISLCHLKTLSFLEGNYVKRHLDDDRPENILDDDEFNWQYLRLDVFYYTLNVYEEFRNKINLINDLEKKYHKIIFDPIQKTVSRLMVVNQAVAYQERNIERFEMSDEQERKKEEIINRLQTFSNADIFYTRR